MRPGCILTPSADEGPYFVDERLLRSDIRANVGGGSPEDGALLTLALRIVDAAGDCPPVEEAHVDVWHCNAYGTYSDEPAEDTVGRTFLRGCQVSDGDGRVAFNTIFPGWYAGRAVHIHVKIRLLRDEQVAYDFTTQLFFDEELIREIYSRPPYASRGLPEVTNDEDYIYRVSGPELTLPVSAASEGSRVATIVIGLSGLRPFE